MGNELQQQGFNTKVPFHTHNSVDGTPILDERYSLTNTRKYLAIRIVSPTVDTTVANVVGGDFVLPFNGFIEEVNATVDTAGTTGTTTIDVNLGGTSIMNTKITIDSTEKTSRTAATPSVLKSQSVGFSLGNILTFDVDAINTTAAKGLVIYITAIKTS